MEEILGDLTVITPSLTEEELWKRLLEQRFRARRIEEIIVELERKRLRVAGQPTLAEAVRRVSKDDCGAGYDVLSFEIDGTARYIEVKSSTGNAIRFYWTLRERTCAQENENYWIYFVPGSQRITARASSVVRIEKPLSWLRRGILTETSTEWLVTENRGAKYVIEHLELR